MDFLRQNAGKLVAALVVFLFAGWLGWRSLSGTGLDAELPNQTQWVCVETGETYWFERGQGVIPPLENPDTGQRTLVPVYEGPDGVLMVTSQAESLLEELGKRNKVVDLDTMTVKGS